MSSIFMNLSHGQPDTCAKWQRQRVWLRHVAETACCCFRKQCCRRLLSGSVATAQDTYPHCNGKTLDVLQIKDHTPVLQEYDFDVQHI
jgi:hypothetical protein